MTTSSGNGDSQETSLEKASAKATTRLHREAILRRHFAKRSDQRKMNETLQVQEEPLTTVAQRVEPESRPKSTGRIVRSSRPVTPLRNVALRKKIAAVAVAAPDQSAAPFQSEMKDGSLSAPASPERLQKKEAALQPNKLGITPSRVSVKRRELVIKKLSARKHMVTQVFNDGLQNESQSAADDDDKVRASFSGAGGSTEPTADEHPSSTTGQEEAECATDDEFLKAMPDLSKSDGDQKPSEVPGRHERQLSYESLDEILGSKSSQSAGIVGSNSSQSVGKYFGRLLEETDAEEAERNTVIHEETMDGDAAADDETSAFDFRSIHDHPPADAARSPQVLHHDPSWDANRVYFNEFESPKKSKSRDVVDFFDQQSWAAETASTFPITNTTTALNSRSLSRGEEKKEKEDDLPVAGSLVGHEDEFDPVGWPRQQNTDEPVESDNEVANEALLEIHDDENLLGDDISRSEAGLTEILGDYNEPLTPKQERLAEYNEGGDDTSEDGSSNKDEDDASMSSNSVNGENFDYKSQVEDDAEDASVMDGPTNDDIFDDIASEPAGYVATFDVAAVAASAAREIAKEKQSLFPDGAFHMDRDGATKSEEPKSFIPEEFLGLPPPPPPPGPSPAKSPRKRSPRKTTASVGKVIPILAPPPEEKLKQWEQSRPSHVRDLPPLITGSSSLGSLDFRPHAHERARALPLITSSSSAGSFDAHEHDKSRSVPLLSCSSSVGSSDGKAQPEIRAAESSDKCIIYSEAAPRSSPNGDVVEDTPCASDLAVMARFDDDQLDVPSSARPRTPPQSKGQGPVSASMVIHDGKLAEKVDMAISAADSKFEEVQMSFSGDEANAGAFVSWRMDVSVDETVPKHANGAIGEPQKCLDGYEEFGRPNLSESSSSEKRPDAPAVLSKEAEREASMRYFIVPNGHPSPFEAAITQSPQILSSILSFLGDPVAVCRIKMTSKECYAYIDDNEHRLMRDAVRSGGMKMNVRPYFWLWVSLQKCGQGRPNDDDDGVRATDLASLERDGREGKWHSVIERDVSRSFGNLPPHKTGARLRTDSIVRALVTWGRGRMVKRGVKGTGDPPPASNASSMDSDDVSLAPTDTVSDWGGVTPVGSFTSSTSGGDFCETKGAIQQNKPRKRRMAPDELALSGNALSEDMKSALKDKLSFILHALAAEHSGVGYCQVRRHRRKEGDTV